MNKTIFLQEPDDLPCKRLNDRYHELREELQKVQAMREEAMHKSCKQIAKAEVTLREGCKALIRELSYHLAPNELEELGGWLIGESGKGQRPEERWHEHIGQKQ